jgi:hypothetical protein
MTTHFPRLNTGTSIKSGGVRLVLWTQTSRLIEIIRSCKCFSRVSKMPTFTYNQANSVIIKNAIIIWKYYKLNGTKYRLCGLTYVRLILNIRTLLRYMEENTVYNKRNAINICGEITVHSALCSFILTFSIYYWLYAIL